MRVYLLRHASAEPRAADGEDRPERHLVKKGRAQCALVGGLLAGMGVQFDRVLSSSYARARETAAAVLERMGTAIPIEADERLVPGATADAALRLIAEQRAGCVLVVGHEPLLSQVTAQAVGYGTAEIVLRKGGLVELDIISCNPVRAELLGLIRPMYLRAAATALGH